MALVPKTNPQDSLSFLMRILESSEKEQQIQEAGAKDDFGALIQLIGNSTDSSKLEGKEKYIKDMYKRLKSLDISNDSPLLGYMADTLESEYDIRKTQIEAFENNSKAFISYQDMPSIDLSKLKEKAQEKINESKLNPNDKDKWYNKDGTEKNDSAQIITNINEVIGGQALTETGKFSWSTYDDLNSYMEFVGSDGLLNHLNERNMHYNEVLTSFETMGFGRNEQTGAWIIPRQFQGKNVPGTDKSYQRLYSELIQESDRWYNMLGAAKTQVDVDGNPLIMLSENEFNQALKLNRKEFINKQAEMKQIYYDGYTNSINSANRYENLYWKVTEKDMTDQDIFSAIEDYAPGEFSDITNMSQLIDTIKTAAETAGSNIDRYKNAYAVWAGTDITAAVDDEYSEFFRQEEQGSGEGPVVSYTRGSKDSIVPYLREDSNGNIMTPWGGQIVDITLAKDSHSIDLGEWIEESEVIEEDGNTVITGFNVKDEHKDQYWLAGKLAENDYFKERSQYSDDPELTGGKIGEHLIFESHIDRDNYIDVSDAIIALYRSLPSGEQKKIDFKKFYLLLDGKNFGLSNLIGDLAEIDWRRDGWGDESQPQGFKIINSRLNDYFRMIEKHQDYLNSDDFKNLKPEQRPDKLKELISLIHRPSKSGNILNLTLNDTGDIQESSIISA